MMENNNIKKEIYIERTITETAIDIITADLYFSEEKKENKMRKGMLTSWDRLWAAEAVREVVRSTSLISIHSHRAVTLYKE